MEQKNWMNSILLWPRHKIHKFQVGVYFMFVALEHHNQCSFRLQFIINNAIDQYFASQSVHTTLRFHLFSVTLVGNGSIFTNHVSLQWAKYILYLFIISPDFVSGGFIGSLAGQCVDIILHQLVCGISWNFTGVSVINSSCAYCQCVTLELFAITVIGYHLGVFIISSCLRFYENASKLF